MLELQQEFFKKEKNMIAPQELENFSRQAAEGYLKNKVSMNESITKIASENGLNRHQIDRVVEGANQNVYVSLFNEAKDKYIEYETADASTISKNLQLPEKTAEASENDYSVSPKAITVFPEMNIFPVTEQPHENTHIQQLHEYYKEAALENQMQERLTELDINYQTEVSRLYSMIKQAYLSGTNFGEIQAAISSVYPEQVMIKTLEGIESELAEAVYPSKLEKTGAVKGTVNVQHPMIKQANQILDIAKEYINVKNKLAELEKSSTVKQVLLKNVAVPALALAGGTGIGIAAANRTHNGPIPVAERFKR